MSRNNEDGLFEKMFLNHLEHTHRIFGLPPTTSLLIHVILFICIHDIYLLHPTHLHFPTQVLPHSFTSHSLILFGESLKCILVIISFLQNINKELISESLMYFANYYIYPMYFYSVVFMRAMNVWSEWQWQAGMAEVSSSGQTLSTEEEILYHPVRRTRWKSIVTGLKKSDWI